MRNQTREFDKSQCRLRGWEEEEGEVENDEGGEREGVLEGGS